MYDENGGRCVMLGENRDLVNWYKYRLQDSVTHLKFRRMPRKTKQQLQDYSSDSDNDVRMEQFNITEDDLLAEAGIYSGMNIIVI